MKLTLFQESDMPLIEKWLSDESLLRFIKLERRCLEKPMIVYLIRFDDDSPVGWVELSNIDEENHKADFGIAIPDKKNWGLGRTATRAFLHMAFEEWKFHRITGRTLADNTRAICSAESFGFVREGVEREAHFDGKGYKDIVVFGMTVEDFKKRVV